MKLNYKSYGHGPALIILHGLFGSLDNWVSHARGLEKDYSVFLLDLRNHGKSFRSAEHNYGLMAEDVQEWMAEEGILSAYVLGHSMGGKVAMELAGRHPFSVEKLIVADMGLKEYPPHHTVILQTLQTIPLHTMETRKEVENYLMEALGNDTVTVQFLLKGLGRDAENRFEWKFNFPALLDNYNSILAGIHPEVFEKPTLFLYGGKSHYVLPEDFEGIKSYFPNAVFQEMPDAGHWLHAENPPLFIQMVKDFLG
ncbi:MAG: alpha/beta fold hydrolase [Bacteroidia bacterium]|nr:alpha/beta fold hydrolase [Bacteroidia bacterium]